MRRTFAAAAILVITLTSLAISAQQRTASQAPSGARAQSTYFPERFEWQHRRPEDVGMNAALVAEAVKAATSQEISWSRDLVVAHAVTYGAEPFDDLIGPLKPRGPVSGLIVHNGYIVAEFGEPQRVDV